MKAFGFKQFYAPLILFLGFSAAAFAEDQPRFEEKREESRFTFALSTGLSNITLNGKKLSGLDAGAGFRFAAMEKLGVGVGMLYTLASKPFGSSLRVNIEPAITYAITGVLTRTNSRTELAAQPVMESVGENPSGLRVSLFLAQAFFGATDSSVSLTGLGGSLSYEFSGWGMWQPIVGVRAERLKNVSNQVTGVSAIVGISLMP